MSIADELSKLEDLRRRGVLSQAEFDKAKAAVLAGGTTAGEAPIVEHLAAQLAEVRYQNELTRIDREWEIERDQYMVTTKYGRQIPTQGASLAGAVIIGVFGVFWTIMAFSITGGAAANDGGPFQLFGCIFPLFGVAFTIFGVWMGISGYGKATRYQDALNAYQARRSAVRPEQFLDAPPEPPQPRDERYTT